MVQKDEEPEQRRSRFWDPSEMDEMQASMRRGFRGREWRIQPSCAVTGDGLYEGFEWASNVVSKK